MPSPIITFRLSHNQLARGLQIIRNLEPNFQLTSLSQIVKVCYNDYLAKMTLSESDPIDPSIMNELQDFISNPSKRTINLASLTDDENNN